MSTSTGNSEMKQANRDIKTEGPKTRGQRKRKNPKTCKVKPCSKRENTWVATTGDC